MNLLKCVSIFQKLAWESDKASGFLFLCKEDETMFLVQRSGLGDHNGEFCGAGGKVEDGETFLEAAKREIEEELGSMPECKILEHSDFHSGNFTYRTYIADLSPEEKAEWKPEINEESSDMGWFPWDELPKPLHPGFKETLKHIGLSPR